MAIKIIRNIRLIKIANIHEIDIKNTKPTIPMIQFFPLNFPSNFLYINVAAIQFIVATTKNMKVMIKMFIL